MIRLENLRWAILVAVVVLAIKDVGIFLAHDGARSWAIDYQVFWIAAHRSVEQVYAASFLPFVYPPTALFFFKLFWGIPFLPGYYGWIALSALLFGLAAQRFAGKLVWLSFFTPSAVRGLVIGQSSMFLAGVMFVAFAVRPIVGGALLGLVLVIKPQLVLLAPLAVIVRRDWKMLAGMTGSASLAVAGTLLLWPTLWLDWVAAMPAFHKVLHEGNVMHLVSTPAGRAEYWGLASLPFLLIGLGIGVVAILTLAAKAQGAALVALITAASIVSSPYALPHDMIGIVPFAILAMRKGDWLTVAGGALLFIGSFTLAPFILTGGLIVAVVRHRKSATSPDERSGTSWLLQP